jgi:hypothetical protein
MFPILYGLVGKVVGWHVYSGPLFNCGFLTLALFVFCLVHKPTALQALVGAFFLMTYWPCYLYLISNSQDPIHLAAAVLFGTCFAALLAQQPITRTRIFHAAFWVLLIYMSLMRISWAAMIFPYIVLNRPLLSPRDLYLRILQAVIGMVILLLAFRWLCAPYPGDDAAFLMNKIVKPDITSIRYVLAHAWYNFKCFVTPSLTYGSFWPGILVFYEAVALGSIMVVIAILGAVSSWTRHRFRLSLPEALFHSYNIWSMAVAMIFFYYVDRNGGWRMFSIHFLMSAVMLIVSVTPRLYWLVIGAGIVNLSCVIPCLEHIENFTIYRFLGPQTTRSFASAIEGLIVYEEGADPWRNTILADRYPPCFAGLPPGIGVSIYSTPGEFPSSPKSKYLLVDVDQLALLPTGARRVWLFHKIGGRFASFSPPSAVVLAINDRPASAATSQDK